MELGPATADSRSDFTVDRIVEALFVALDLGGWMAGARCRSRSEISPFMVDNLRSADVLVGERQVDVTVPADERHRLVDIELEHFDVESRRC